MGARGYRDGAQTAQALAWERQFSGMDRAILSVVRPFRAVMGWAEEPTDPRALAVLVRCLIAVVLLNGIDAGLTIWQVGRQPAFVDLNPVVQAFITAGHPGGIALLKLLTLSFATVVLLTYYTRPSAQLAGKVALAITLWVYVHWAIYLTGYLSTVI